MLKACLKCHFFQIVPESVKWKRWENERLMKTCKSGKKEVFQTRKILSEKSGSYKEFVNELSEELEPFASHLFNAKWQYQQYKKLKENLPNDWVLGVADFAENYRCMYQDEISSAYYQYKQATLHPVVLFHHCPDCNETMTTSCVCITSDLVHDAFAVAAFQATVKDHLKNGGSNIAHFVQFSDGCSAQYKSKTPFSHVARSQTSEERAFFGSRHGKGPCDALGGIVKNAATRHVRNRQGIIRDAKEFFEFAQTLTINPNHGEAGCHNKRLFFFVDNIIHDKGSDSVTVPMTRKLHSVKNNLTTDSAILMTRNLACFCTGCISASKCENQAYVKEWKENDLSLKSENTRKTKGKVVMKRASVKIPGKDEKKKIQIPTLLRRTAKRHGSTYEGDLNHNELESDDEPLAKMASSKLSEVHESRRKKKLDDMNNFSLKSRRGTKRKVQGDSKTAGSKMTLDADEVLVKSSGNRRKAKSAKRSVSRRSTKKSKYVIMSPSKASKLMKSMAQKAHDPQVSASSKMQLEEFSAKTDWSILKLKASVDGLSQSLIPEDVPLLPHLSFPVVIEADGNCLARVGSLAAYGSEEHHLDIRLRIGLELINHRDLYLDEQYLSRGLAEGTMNAATIAQYSKSYIARRLTVGEIRDCYQADLSEVLTPGAFMGLWALFALSSVLGMPIQSIYPKKGSSMVRDHIHRLIMPRRQLYDKTQFIMWTSTRNDMAKGHWQPNHFSLVLPLSIRFVGFVFHVFKVKDILFISRATMGKSKHKNKQTLLPYYCLRDLCTIPNFLLMLLIHILIISIQ